MNCLRPDNLCKISIVPLMRRSETSRHGKDPRFQIPDRILSSKTLCKFSFLKRLNNFSGHFLLTVQFRAGLTAHCGSGEVGVPYQGLLET